METMPGNSKAYSYIINRFEESLGLFIARQTKSVFRSSESTEISQPCMEVAMDSFNWMMATRRQKWKERNA